METSASDSSRKTETKPSKLGAAWRWVRGLYGNDPVINLVSTLLVLIVASLVLAIPLVIGNILWDSAFTRPSYVRKCRTLGGSELLPRSNHATNESYVCKTTKGIVFFDADEDKPDGGVPDAGVERHSWNVRLPSDTQIEVSTVGMP